MQIFVRMHTSKTMTLDVDAADSIGEVKAIIQAQEGILPED